VRNLADKIVNAYHYRANLKANAGARPGQKPRILFCVPFYGYTGGAFAVLSAANLLAESCEVSFLTRPDNVMNRYVSPGVRMVAVPQGAYDFCVIECGIDETLVAGLKRDGARIILTMHGAPSTEDGEKNHGYSDEQLVRGLKVADSLQYVSDVQAPFVVSLSGFHSRKIPNYVLPVSKTRRCRAAGVVCDTTLPHKNADACVAGAESSSAERIEVWGKCRDRRSTGRVRWNGFSSNKAQIYNSFDVLVHLSRLENQPLVILEAMSAGIPCVLAPLPTYAGFRGVEGIYFAEGRDEVAGKIDQALDCPQSVRDGLARYWDANYSPQAVLAQWTGYLKDVRELKEQGANALSL
jgi:hypothetical protein